MGRGTFGDEFGGAIITNGDFTASVFDSASTAKVGVYEKLAKSNDCSTKTHAAKCCCRGAMTAVAAASGHLHA